MNNKIRILYTISNFNTAGSGKVIYDLAKGLDKEKFEVAIACGSDKGEILNRFRELGIPIYVHKMTNAYRPYFTLFHRLKPTVRFLKKHRFHIVHSWHWSSDWTEIMACKLAGSKYIFTKKSMGFKSKHWNLKSFLADFIITVNSDMSKFFSYKKNQKLIPFGLETSFYSNASDNSGNDQTFRIITVANLVPVKGIEYLIEAVNELRHLNLELFIVGYNDTDYALGLKKLVENNRMNGIVTFTGKQMDVRPYLAKSDLFVIPTLQRGEGMPMALLEAMSMGIPVIGSDIPGINYVLKDFKELLFLSENKEQLVEKISMIINSSRIERQNLGKKLRRYCVEHFSMGRFIDAHQNLYKEIIS